MVGFSSLFLPSICHSRGVVVHLMRLEGGDLLGQGFPSGDVDGGCLFSSRYMLGTSLS